jgi:hypothetical protein
MLYQPIELNNLPIDKKKISLPMHIYHCETELPLEKTNINNSVPWNTTGMPANCFGRAGTCGNHRSSRGTR